MKNRLELEAIDQLIESCKVGADIQRRIEQAFKNGVISKGPRDSTGQMHPETIEWMERHAEWAKELEDIRDRLFDLRTGKIEHL